jgi:uncharacterized membrane protein YhaH (DUF805 family)
MPDFQFHIQSFWAPVVLYGLAFWLVSSIDGLRGKPWLIAFLITRVLGNAFNYVPQLLLRDGMIETDTYRDILLSGFPGVVNIVGYAFLVGFAFAMTPAGAGGGLGRTLFSFKGRLTRQPFWLVTATIGTVNLFIVALFADNDPPTGARLMALGGTYLLWLPLVTWIGLAVQVKRWHDLNKSGWWVLIGLIPVIGLIWSIVEPGFVKGTNGENRFGPAADAAEPALAHV